MTNRTDDEMIAAIRAITAPHGPLSAGFSTEILSRLAQPQARLTEEVEAQRKAKDGAYFERNQLVALLAHIYPSGIKKTAIEGWAEDWHNCVYINFPTGQGSWHYHDDHENLFRDLPPYQGEWDGHTTDQKYDRLWQLRQRITAPGQVQGAWQKIESAPKDGKDILITTFGIGMPRRIGFWDEARGGQWSMWPGRDQMNPTHWMPLPKSPSKAEDEK